MVTSLYGLLWFTAGFYTRPGLSVFTIQASATFVCEVGRIIWGANERKIDSPISETLVQKASDISACVMHLCKEQMFPL